MDTQPLSEMHEMGAAEGNQAALIQHGVYVPPFELQHCVIICDVWPSWLFICETCGFICDSIYMFSGQHSEGWKNIAKHFSVTKMFDGAQLDSTATWLWPPTTLVLIQGDHPTCQDIFIQCFNDVHRRAIYVLPATSTLECPSQSFELPHVLLSHEQCGGILDSRWKVFATSQYSFQEASAWASIPRRRLKHVVNQAVPMTKEVADTPPNDDQVRSCVWFVDSQRRCLHWGGLLSSRTPLLPLRCRSVFSATGWTTRPLTVSELGHAYDLNSGVISTFSTVHQSRRHTLPFLHAAPAKILLFAWMQCLGGTHRGTGRLEKGDSGGGTLFLRPHTQIEAAGEEKSARMALSAEDRNKNAIKADDAEIPIWLWDDRVWKLQLHCEHRRRVFEQRYRKCPLTVWRSYLVCAWRLRVTRSLLRFLQRGADSEREANRHAGRDCIERACGADWWEWLAGSRLFFWRWPRESWITARDGFPFWVNGRLPRYHVPQRREKDDRVRAQVQKKLETVLRRGYIIKGNVKSLTGYFAVPKGPEDIRMVYDGTKSGLNDVLWAPNFMLPSVDTLVNAINEDSWMADLDLGEMFLNFMLHPEIQPYCGVDLSPYFGKAKGGWQRWGRCAMGLKTSPYLCVKGLLLGEEVIQGDIRDPKNSFGWDTVLLNLPGDEKYNPSEPRVKRIRKSTGKLAAIMVKYVDDLRPTGSSEKECWEATHQAGSRMTYLGLQDATRKTRPPSQTP